MLAAQGGSIGSLSAARSFCGRRTVPARRGEVWMLANELRLLRLVEGGANSVTLHNLADAAVRASALAERYPGGSGSPTAAPRN